MNTFGVPTIWLRNSGGLKECLQPFLFGEKAQLCGEPGFRKSVWHNTTAPQPIIKRCVAFESEFLDEPIEFKKKVELTLKQWSQKADYEAGKLLRSLKLKADQWWYFLVNPEIPSDNNLAERSSRLAIPLAKS